MAKQTSIQMDAEWQALAAELAVKWGIATPEQIAGRNKSRHITAVLRECTLKIHTLEIGYFEMLARQAGRTGRRIGLYLSNRR